MLHSVRRLRAAHKLGAIIYPYSQTLCMYMCIYRNYIGIRVPCWSYALLPRPTALRPKSSPEVVTGGSALLPRLHRAWGMLGTTASFVSGVCDRYRNDSTWSQCKHMSGGKWEYCGSGVPSLTRLSIMIFRPTFCFCFVLFCLGYIMS